LIHPGISVGNPYPLFRTEVASNLGKVRIVWVQTSDGSRVQRIALPRDEIAHDGRSSVEHLDSLSSYPVIETLIRRIETFLEGRAVEFDLTILDFTRCGRFQQKVLLAEYGIPRGHVSTYGRIASHLGVPRGGRAVGGALASNPFPLVIPCHRAVRSNGDLGGFRGGLEIKETLLRMEGVRFRPNGRVIMDRVYY
jgi:methylated-DNA-[protein]-cysteine S-methyltransferase